MTAHAHLTYPVLAVYVANIWLQLPITWVQYFFLAFFSFLPDLDIFAIYAKFGMKGLTGEVKVMHHNWVSHWPVAYLPFWVATFFYPHWVLIFFTIGTFSHLVMDTIYGGIMWFAPFSRKKYNFEPENMRDLSQLKWLQAYRKLPVYKLDLFLSVALISILFYELIQIIS